MSSDNVETVLGVFDAFGRRDTDATFSPTTPASSGACAWLEDFDDYETEAREPVDLGDKVVVTVWDCARGKGSGVPIERYHAQIWTFRDGRIVRVEIFDDRSGALDAASGRGPPL